MAIERNEDAYYDLLKGTIARFNDRIRADKLTRDGEYHDALHEVVDEMVPHYHYEIFAVMAADGINFMFEDSDMMPDTKDVSRILQARIYESLYNAVQEDTAVVWYDEEDEEEEEDEDEE